MRVIDCDCGRTLQAANDDDLFRVAREHMDTDHPGQDISDEQLRQLIGEQAYSATDS